MYLDASTFALTHVSATSSSFSALTLASWTLLQTKPVLLNHSQRLVIAPRMWQRRAAQSSKEQHRTAKSSAEQYRAAKSSAEQRRAAQSSTEQHRAVQSGEEHDVTSIDYCWCTGMVLTDVGFRLALRTMTAEQAELLTNVKWLVTNLVYPFVILIVKNGYQCIIGQVVWYTDVINQVR